MDKASPMDAGPGNFVAEIVQEDEERDRFGGRFITRFPPEPNGYLHIGHAKSICLNFGLASRFGGHCNLRFDDTNPEAESIEYVEAIRRDLQWLGFDPGRRVFFASSYFEQLYQWAERLVTKGLAYVDDQSEDEVRAARGNFYEQGKNSPCRDRTPEENLSLLRRMRAGEFDDGARVLRAKIDMQSKDLKLRDPLMYRIKHTTHHRTGDAWCIYPMYDWAHGQADALEEVTHSICTLEFVNHRSLYDWFLEALEVPQPPRQIEFARLALTYVVTSKRKLLQLVQDGHVEGWDDPRMPTLAGMRRLGIPPAAIRAFCDRIGVSKHNALVDIALFEHAVRESLNASASRRMGVLKPLKLTIENWPEDHVEYFALPNHPEDPDAGVRHVPFGKHLWVEQDDFQKEPPKKWFRLAEGREVRLRGACLVTCNEVIEDESGCPIELVCTWDPDSRGGDASDGRRVRGTLHWVSASHALDATVRLYDRLFRVEDPTAAEHFVEHLNPESCVVIRGCKLEPALLEATAGEPIQFERLGYFTPDPESKAAGLLFNRTISLKDSWARSQKKS
ncbi:MAG: glutamine--tRNA ligase/YqeY domain fusion protein [Myxococcota bacterium]